MGSDAASGYFSEDYAQARARFLEACRGVGATLECRENPVQGPGGETLATDVAWLGDEAAERVLLTISATHGVEGYCGSGVQTGWLESGLHREVPAGIAQLMIHAINPYGFAWGRRVTEENVDLNRNFADFDAALPESPGYDELHAALCPLEWTTESIREIAAVIAAYRADRGSQALQDAVSSGQYGHADGVFYGGDRPTWSRRTFLEILGKRLARARHVAVIDYHTGLGPFGHGERICVHPPGSQGAARAAAWYEGDLTSPDDGTSVSSVLTGTNANGTIRALSEQTFTWIALEYGTYTTDEVLLALLADNWLHLHGDPASPLGREIKAEIRRCFYPETDEWKQMVWERAVETQRLALRNLAET